MSKYSVTASLLCAMVAASPSIHAKPTPTIVGGHEALPHSYPFVVSIQDKDSSFHFCGGTLINDHTVLTAAHCLQGEQAGALQVVLGEHNLAKDESTEQVLPVKKITVHPDYDSYTMINDVGLIELAEPAVFNQYVSTIDLPYQDQYFSGKTTVIGWGDLSSGGRSPDELNEVDISLVSTEACKTAYGEDKIEPGMICASAAGKDSCQGDSGGPLFQNGILVGIVSWGYGCASPSYPGVYTNVSSFVDYIQSNNS